MQFFFFGTLLLRHNSTTTTTKQQQYFGDAHTNAHICGVFLGLMCVCVRIIDFYTDHPLQPQV